MSTPGVVAATDLISAPGEPNASIGGVPLRLNPTSVNLSFQMKMAQTQTLGGMVVQIFGVEWGDLVVQGEFGAGSTGEGGWVDQYSFFQLMLNNVSSTVAAQKVQAVNGTIPSSGSYRFLFPLLGYDFMVYLKSYDSLEGTAAVILANENINPTYQLTFTIDTDNTTLSDQQTTAIDQYISGLQEGLGYAVTQFNGPVNTVITPTTTGTGFTISSSPGAASSDVQSWLSQYYPGESLGQAFVTIFGTSPNSSAPPTPTSTTPTGSTSGATLPLGTNEQAVFYYFTNQGLSPVQSAAIVGNFMRESGCDPTAIQKDANGNIVADPGRGIAQWTTSGRWQGVVQLASTRNVDPATLQVQLDFSWSELNGDFSSVLSALKAETDINAATDLFNSEYEISADDSNGILQREKYASDALAAFQAVNPSP
jgi:Phage tail lysozyme